MNKLRDNLEHAWQHLQSGWNNLLSKASDALTRFRGEGEAPDEDARTLMRLSPDWGLLAAEVRESENELRVRLEAPGMQAADLKLEVQGKLLSISGEKRYQRESDQGHYHVTECAYGSFQRQIALPSEVDAEHTSAQYQDGVLILHLPKAERARVRRIQVKGG